MAVLISVFTTACAPAARDPVVVPDVRGLRGDVAVVLLNEAGFSRVSLDDVVSTRWILDSDESAVVDQSEIPGAEIDPRERIYLDVGPLDNPGTLNLLEPDAPIRGEVQRQLDANREPPTPDPDARFRLPAGSMPGTSPHTASTEIGTLQRRAGPPASSDLPLPEILAATPTPGTAVVQVRGGWEGDLTVGDPADGLVQCAWGNAGRGPELTVTIADAPGDIDPYTVTGDRRIFLTVAAVVDTINDDGKPWTEVKIGFRSDAGRAWSGYTSNSLSGQGSQWKSDGQWDGHTLRIVATVVTLIDSGMDPDTVDSTTISTAVTCPTT